MDKANSSDELWIQRMGGAAAIVFGAAYVAIIILYLPLGGKPTGAEAWLSQTAEHAAAWWGILGLSVLTDFLLVPISFSLYQVLKDINKNAMRMATVFVGLFIFLDLALTWTNIGSLVSMGGRYAVAGEAEKAALLTAALYPATIADSNLIFIYNSLTLAVGILLTGLVMRKGLFNKLTALTGIAAGALAVISVAGSFFSSSLGGITIILASLFTTIWYFLVGFKLLRYGQR